MNRTQRISPTDYARRVHHEERPTLVDLLARRPELVGVGVAAVIAGMKVAGA